MIDIKLLTKKDIDRPIIYHRIDCDRDEGVLTSWNHHYVFVKFKGPNSAACEPEDVSFKEEVVVSKTKLKKLVETNPPDEDWFNEDFGGLY